MKVEGEPSPHKRFQVERDTHGSDVLASVARPVMQLAGFTRIHLAPGESREVSFRLGPAQLRMLDADMKWVVEPGAFRIMVGASSKDIRLRGELVVR